MDDILKRKLRIAVIISGNGGNLQAIIDAANARKDYPAEIVCVISNRPDAYGLERARKHNIPAIAMDHKQASSREAFDMQMHDVLLKHDVELVVLAGYMRLLTPEFVNLWKHKMINIHPSILPAFKGANAVRDALEYGVKITGCTVHFVVPEMDAGPIIAQAAVAVMPEDTEDSLADKIHVEEHKLYPAVINMLALHKLLAN